MQAKATDDLRRMVTDRLVAEGLVYEGASAFATPRRLTLTVHGIPARQSDLKEERKGPRVGGPDAAIAGFLKATGLASLDQAKIQRDPKKGDFYVALIEKPGRATLDVLADMLPIIIRTFPWPKSMRWGERSARPGALQWVRPLHAIVATFGLETEQPDVVKFAVEHIEAGETTFGHRFMAPAPITVRRFEDYEAKLLAAKVVLDPERRKDTILDRCQAAGVRTRARTGRGSVAARRSRRFGRMAGGRDGVIRAGIPVDSAGGDPSHRPKQHEMFRGAGSQDRQADQQIHSHRQHRSVRWRKGNRRRQRARDPRPAFRREVLLRKRPENQARGAPPQIRGHCVSREAWQPGRAHQAD